MKNSRHTRERLELQFDGRAWSVGYTMSDATQGAVTEYVLPGETVHAWTELVTIERLPPAQRHVDVNSIIETMREHFARTCLGLFFHVIERRGQDVLYEWRHDGAPGEGHPAQHEISRLVKGKTGIHRVAYVAKVNPLPPQKREQWAKLIGQAKWARPAAAAARGAAMPHADQEDRLSRMLLRLYGMPPGGKGDPKALGYAYRIDLEDTCTVLLLASEQEGQYLIIKEDDLLAWGISAQQAFARASLNVGKIATQTEQINLGNDPCFAIRGDSFAAEKALDLGNWFPHLAGRMGALVAFPCTNAAFIVPLPTLRIETVVRLFVGLMDTGYEVYSLAQNGISFRVYWWYDGRFFALPVTRLARGLVFSYVFPHMGPPSEHGENRRFLHEPKGSETEKPDGSRRDRIMSVIHNHDRRLISLLEHNRQGKVICIWGEFNMEHPEEATAVLHRELSD